MGSQGEKVQATSVGTGLLWQIVVPVIVAVLGTGGLLVCRKLYVRAFPDLSYDGPRTMPLCGPDEGTSRERGMVYTFCNRPIGSNHQKVKCEITLQFDKEFAASSGSPSRKNIDVVAWPQDSVGEAKVHPVPADADTSSRYVCVVPVGHKGDGCLYPGDEFHVLIKLAGSAARMLSQGTLASSVVFQNPEGKATERTPSTGILATCTALAVAFPIAGLGWIVAFIHYSRAYRRESELVAAALAAGTGEAVGREKQIPGQTAGSSPSTQDPR